MRDYEDDLMAFEHEAEDQYDDYFEEDFEDNFGGFEGNEDAFAYEEDFGDPMYDNFGGDFEDFGEVYLFSNFDTYDNLSFMVKPKDKHYTIYFIKGSIIYDDKLEQCFAKQKEIEKEFSSIYKNAKKRKTFSFLDNAPRQGFDLGHLAQLS